MISLSRDMFRKTNPLDQGTKTGIGHMEGGKHFKFSGMHIHCLSKYLPLGKSAEEHE
jgi:hypothetical protein